jgi:hypothetical protein
MSNLPMPEHDEASAMSRDKWLVIASYIWGAALAGGLLYLFLSA